MVEKRAGRIKKLFIGLSFASTLMAAELCGADLSFYARSGYMDWREHHADGSIYIQETGATAEIGLTHTINISRLEVAQKLGVWGAGFAYDGVSAETLESKKMTTGNLGIKYNLTLGWPIKLGERIELTPQAGSGIDYFWRFVGPEEWVVLSGRGGIRGKARTCLGQVVLAGGVNYPYHTTDTVDWTSIGAVDKVTVSPKGRLTPFFTAEVELDSRWTVGIFYEPLKWAASETMPFRYSGNNYGAAIAQYDQLFQPETQVEYIGISATYRF